MAMPFPVFLSSLGKELFGLRESIFWKAGRGERIYVDELLHRRDLTNQVDLSLVDELMARIDQADAFLCVFAGRRHGWPVKSGDTRSVVSFFEFELFYAAFRRKAIHVLVRDDFEPEPSLQALLEMLHFAFPNWRNQKRLSDPEIIDTARRIADSVTTVNPPGPMDRIWTPAKRIAQALYIGRGMTGTGQQFLNGVTAPEGHTPRLELVDQLLHADNVMQNQQYRLSRLWLAVRELNTMPINQMKDADQLQRFEEVLGKWSGAGAWHGLHANIALGCEATVNTIYSIRLRRRELGSLPLAATPYPAGELASVKYSAAKNLLSLRDRRTRLHEALRDIELAYTQSAEDKSGILAVRGSIHRSLGHVFACLKDHEESLQIRHSQNAPSEAIGGSMVELGFACIYSLQLRRALRLCEEGVERMQGKSDGGNMARALRKLAIAYAVNGKLAKARETQARARTIALTSGALDQLR